jgi:hypothetical protein
MVSINTDPAERIAELYGIGAELSERIVAHREDAGPFRDPEELARVDGVSLELAITLAPHIDWDVPTIPEWPKERNWIAGLLLALCSGFFAWLILTGLLPRLLSGWDALGGGTPSDWFRTWLVTSGSIWAILCTVAMALYAAAAIGTSRARVRRLKRFTIVVVCVSLLIAISYVLGILVLIGFENSSHGTSLSSTSVPALLPSVMLILLALLAGPLFLVMWRPELRLNAGLERAFDIAFSIAGPVVAWSYWSVRGILPIWLFAPVGGLGGLLTIAVGVFMLRTGTSVFQSMANWLVEATELQSTLQRRRWLSWLNARMPDPEQQRALKVALDEVYPRSRWRTFVGVVVIGVGGWLVVTAVTAIVEWIIQRGLDKLFP